jgi:hypothetical protein
MAKKINKQGLEVLINSRLGMQSTQRNLAVYNISVPSFKHFKNEEFLKRYGDFTSLEKRRFLNIVAGPIFWRDAQELIEGNTILE